MNTESPNYIELKNVSKSIGKKQVLQDISYSFVGGKVYLLRGQNGSGKTMLIRLISGLIYEDKGVVVYNGVERKKNGKPLFSMGLILENDGMFEGMKLYDNLKYLASVNHQIGEKEIRSAMNKVGLGEEKRRLSKYSLGMKRRAMIAQSIMEEPEVLLWDEPTNVLDEEGRHIFYEICEEQKKRGAIVIISSHLQENLQDMCDVILDIESGEIVRETYLT